MTNSLSLLMSIRIMSSVAGKNTLLGTFEKEARIRRKCVFYICREHTSHCFQSDACPLAKVIINS